MLLRVDNVSVANPSPARGDEYIALVNNVSFALDAGEVLAIIGPNGAGKSTLLKAIAGEWSHSGDIQMAGLSNRPTERARQFAVLPQQSVLNFPFRVSEVVSLGRIPHATGQQLDQEIVAEALAMMDISYLSERLYTELSGGEKQRVQLARALAQIWRVEDAPNQTRLLLLDEPTAALDLGHQRDLLTAVRAFAEQGVGIIMVLHDVNLAVRYADKLLAMICSETLAYGNAEDVVKPELMKKLFDIDVTIMPHPQTGKPILLPE